MEVLHDVADQPKFPPTPTQAPSPETQCGIYDLPEELLLKVFLVLLDDPYGISKFQRAALILVCKPWRRIVTGTPPFWTTIDWTDRRQQWEDYLILSKGLPFTINYDAAHSQVLGSYVWSRGGRSRSRVAPQNPVPLFDWVTSQSILIRTLRFTHQRSVEAWNSLWRVLSRTNLDLREIELISLGGGTGFQPGPHETFLGTLAPRVQSVTLNCVVVPWRYFAVPTLRSLSITFPTQRQDSVDISILPRHINILSIMSSCTLLETVRIIGLDTNPSGGSTTPPVSIVTPQHLKELTVQSASGVAICDLLEHLDLPQTARTNFTISPPWDSSAGSGEIAFARLVSLLAGNSLLQDCHLELADTSLRVTDLCHEVRLVYTIRHIGCKEAVRRFSEQARSLVVSASLSSWCGFFPELPFPRLTAIEVGVYMMPDVLSFVRARNSPNRTEEDKRSGQTRISRLRITGAPFGSRGGRAWAEFQALVEYCDIKVRSLSDLD